MKKLFGAGSLSAFLVAASLALGGSSEALAQQVQARLPVVQAVVRTEAPAPIPAVTVDLPPAPLPLSALVDANGVGERLDSQGECLATAVYFESQGEPLEGQLAVAQVVINRARSGRYPASWCDVVKQKAQFSFVRNGRFPRIDMGSDGWRKAEAIARIASKNLASVVTQDVLWYHADYVAPTWRRNLAKTKKIGAHIFYRA